MFGFSSMYCSYLASTPMVPKVVIEMVMSPSVSPPSPPAEQPTATMATAAAPAMDAMILLRGVFTGHFLVCARMACKRSHDFSMGALPRVARPTVRTDVRRCQYLMGALSFLQTPESQKRRTPLSRRTGAF